MIDIDVVKEIVIDIPYVEKVYDFKYKDAVIYGKVQILFNGLKEALDFKIELYPQYPLRHHESESITFYNEDLLDCNHVMKNGSICIHTSHNTDLKQKLLIDFDSLKSWIEKYYINKDKDLNYEHIVVPECLVDDMYYSYIFTEVDYKFNKGDYGEVKISELSHSLYKSKNIKNYVVQNFSSIDKDLIECKWSKSYVNSQEPTTGFYYFIEEHPAKYKRFIFENWKDFDGLLSVEFLDKLHNFDKKNKKYRGKLIPFFVGYRTIGDEIHWQVAMLTIGKFPTQGVVVKNNGVKTGKWDSKLVEQNIQWAITRDSSYKYFFGRGILNQKITDSKILIIGVGAIGSMIAKTLVRGGCRYIDIADYDVKEPENICRSEYMFHFGLGDKVVELQQILTTISPFLDIQIANDEYFESIIKTFHQTPEVKKAIVANLNKYDIVIDCTTDNDLMYILDSLSLDVDMLNISITNHAQELVCAFYPNIYHFVNTQFSAILKHDLNDLYEPTGCWSPTFKASYNDINMMVQVAIKHINNLYTKSKPKNNFIVEIDENDVLSIKIREY